MVWGPGREGAQGQPQHEVERAPGLQSLGAAGFLARLSHWYALSLTAQITPALLGPFYRTLSLQQKVMYENIEILPAY